MVIVERILSVFETISMEVRKAGVPFDAEIPFVSRVSLSMTVSNMYLLGCPKGHNFVYLHGYPLGYDLLDHLYSITRIPISMDVILIGQKCYCAMTPVKLEEEPSNNEESS